MRCASFAFGVVFAVFIAAQVFELYYKLNLPHLQPPRSIAQHDGPSISMLFASGAGFGNSFPSGHVLRAVIVYGLLLTELVVVAVVVRLGLPVTSLVVNVSPLLKPVDVALNVGFGSPYSRVLLSAVTASVAFVIVND